MEEYIWSQIINLTTQKINEGQVLTTSNWNTLNTK